MSTQPCISHSYDYQGCLTIAGMVRFLGPCVALICDNFLVCSRLFAYNTHYAAYLNFSFVVLAMGHFAESIRYSFIIFSDIVQSVKSIHQYLRFRKTIFQYRGFRSEALSNEMSFNFTFYWGIHESLNSFIFEKITFF